MNVSRTHRFLLLVTTLLLSLQAAYATVLNTVVEDDDGDLGLYTSLQMRDGQYPVIAYHDYANSSLKLATCIADCLSEGAVWQIVTVDDEGDVGSSASLQLLPGGEPVIAYYDAGNGDLKLAVCTADCQGNDPAWTITVVDSGGEAGDGDAGYRASLQLDSEGNPVIAYNDDTEASTLKLATCVADCDTDEAAWQIVSVDDAGGEIVLRLVDDMPVIAWQDYDSERLKLATCTDAVNTCRYADPVLDWNITVVGEGGGIGRALSLQLDAYGRAYMSFYYDESLGVLACSDSDCGEGSLGFEVNVPFVEGEGEGIEASDYGTSLQVQFDDDDEIVAIYLSYAHPVTGQLLMASCDIECLYYDPDEAQIQVLMDRQHAMGYDSSMQLADDGDVVVSHYDYHGGALKLSVLSQPPAPVQVDVPEDGDYVTGEELSFTVEFDHAVYFNQDDIRLELTLASGPVFAAFDYEAEIPWNMLRFHYTLQDDDNAEDGIVVAQIVLGDDTFLEDVTGNDVQLAINAPLAGVNVNADYAVSFNALGNGTAIPGTELTLPSGESASFTLAPNAGFRAEVYGTCGGATSGDTYMTLPLTRDCTVDVAFLSEQTVPFAEDAEYLASTGLAAMNVAPAYARGLTGQGVTIGVIDGSLYAGSVEFSGVDLAGYDFVDDTASLNGPGGHGSAVSGIALARRNGYGMQGVAFEADLVYARSIGGGLFDSGPFTEGLDFIRNFDDVRVINNSFGIPGSIVYDETKPDEGGFVDRAELDDFIDLMQFRPAMDAIEQAVADDTILVFANGNEGHSHAQTVAGLPYFYPELRPNFIAVTSMTATGEHNDMTNKCGVAASWCVMARGSDLLAPTGSNEEPASYYDSFGGTSGAAPHVTGAVALLLQQFPWMSGAQIVSTLLTTATDGTDAVLSPVSGRGAVDVGKAIDGPAAFEFSFTANTQGQDAIFANDISGIGSLTKSGAGTLTLAGTNTYAGTTTVNGGELHVSGSLDSATELASGGKLSGTGTVDALTVSGGTLAPGASAGTFSSGNLVLQAAAMLEFELHDPNVVGDDVNDLIAVSGDLTLDGALQVANAASLAPGTYTLITYTGALVDNGMTIASSASGKALSLSAGDGSVRLLVVATQASDPDPSSGPEPTQSPVLSGPVVNSGTLLNPVITPNASVEGGTLAGNISNGGSIRDVTLAPGAQVNGGTLGGSITGSENAPAFIANADITAGGRLQNVVIGTGSTLQPGVELGPNVRFESDAGIPAGFDLTGALRTLGTLGDGLREGVDLDDDVILSADGNAPSLIRAIQLLDAFEQSGGTIGQESDGELLVVTDDFHASMLPVRVSMAAPDEEPGVYVTADGDVVFVTASRRVVLAHPTLQNHAGFAAALGLDFRYDADGALIVTSSAVPRQGQALRLAGSDDPRAALVLDDSDYYYSARPDVLALPAASDASAGLRSEGVPGLPNVSWVHNVFANDAGVMMDQLVVPWPAEWALLKAALTAQAAFSDVAINARGIISVTHGATQVRGLVSYQVYRDSASEAQPVRVTFLAAGDINGDGRNDYWLVYPNGERQALYVFP